MYYALDKNGKRVRINNADVNATYLCPTCGQNLIQRRSGSYVLPHFAHHPSNRSKGEYTPCVDRWKYDSSEWAQEWQNRFPEENQEVVIGDVKEKHRADVCLDNVVIEFQKENITNEKFKEKNSFFNKLGYTVIWIFDLRDEFSSGKIRYIGKDSDGTKDIFRWDKPKRFFEELRLMDTDAEIYLQFRDPAYNVSALYHVDEQRFCFKDIYADKAYPIGVFAKSVSRIHSSGKGKTIYQLWSSEFRAMVVSCGKSGREILINGVDGAMEKDEQGRIIGKIRERGEDGKFHSIGSGANYVIFETGVPKWILKRWWERDK